MTQIPEVPESYLAMLAESPPLPTERHNPLETDQKQKLALLDALAGICVSQPTGEVYATATEIEQNRSTIFIIGNDAEVPEKTQLYLTEVCSRLAAVAADVDASRPSTVSDAQQESDLDPTLKDKIDRIHGLIFSFTFEKFKARLMKRNEDWETRIGEIESRLHGPDLEKFQSFIRDIQDIYDEVMNPRPDKVLIRKFLAALAIEWPIKDELTMQFLQRLDLLPSLNGETFSLLRYWRKALKTHQEASALVKFALSSRRSPLFRKKPTVVALHSPKRRITLDTGLAATELKGVPSCTEENKKDISGMCEQAGQHRNFYGCSHCECGMLAALLKLWPTRRPADAIGVSKPSCLSCRLYFSAYQTAHKDFQADIDLPVFYVSGTYDNLYFPWTSPDLSPVHPAVHAAVQKEMVTLVQNAFMQQVRIRRLSESTTNSSDMDDGEHKNIGAIREEIKRRRNERLRQNELTDPTKQATTPRNLVMIGHRDTTYKLEL